MDLHSPVAKGGSPNLDLTLTLPEFANHDCHRTEHPPGRSVLASILPGISP